MHAWIVTSAQLAKQLFDFKDAETVTCSRSKYNEAESIRATQLTMVKLISLIITKVEVDVEGKRLIAH